MGDRRREIRGNLEGTQMPDAMHGCAKICDGLPEEEGNYYMRVTGGVFCRS